MEIANKIYEQIGGPKFVAMTGAKNFMGVENGIQFSYGRNSFCTITLNSKDLYDVSFQKMNKKTYEIAETGKFCDVFVENLAETFEKHTGLYIKL